MAKIGIRKEETTLFGDAIQNKSALREKYTEPPFSILDTMGSEWMTRRNLWKTLGIKSEKGRDVVTYSNSFANEKYGRTEKDAMAKESIFDPALCELMYTWFGDTGTKWLDPFAGGSVRGIVCNYLGHKYTGIDIRPEQIEDNYIQSEAILPLDNQPVWHVGDSNKVLDVFKPNSFGGLLSCPPYADLEVYSDMDGDISNLKYREFLPIYSSIINKACNLLKEGSFAVWIVGEVRDKKTGHFYGFVPDTIECFKKAGMKYYNEIILKNSVGSAMLRASNTFERGNKKIAKIHQNILVFIKPKKFSLDD